MLLLVLLALAFAGPFITGGRWPVAGGRKLTVVAIDNSFSMRQGDRLDRARQEALQVLSRLSAGDQAQVLSFAREVRLMTEAVGDQAALRGAVAAIQPSDSRSSYGDLARALRSMAQSSRLPLEVHLFSDLQKSSMPAGFRGAGTRRRDQSQGASQLPAHAFPTGPWRAVTAPRAA